MATRSKKTFSEVQAQLKNLPLGEYKITDLLNIIWQYDGFQSTTTQYFKEIDSWKKSQSNTEVEIDEIYVDLTYQRKLTLKKLLNNLKKAGGFSKEKAGHIDVAIRPNGKKYAWDGFRRCVMAGLCNIKKISCSVFEHHVDKKISECSQYEADLFLARNALSERMGADEIFVAKVAKGETKAYELNTVLKRSRINVCGLNPNGKLMGGFATVERHLGYHDTDDNSQPINKIIDDDDFVFSADLVSESWPKDSILTCYLLLGLANVRKLLKNDIESNITDNEIIERIKDYAKTHKQTSLTDNRLTNKMIESVSYNILKDVFKLGNRSRVISGLSVDETNLLQEAA